jgi:peptide/nickel transport system substrate-binding protein
MRWATLLAALVVWLGQLGCETGLRETPPGVLSVSVEQQSAWVRTFNPLAPGEARWPTRAGIYEPLLVHNPVAGEWVPWLATSWSWADDLRSVTFTIRDGVQWSDGRPMTAADVAYTFELLRAHPALDQGGVWSFVERVSVADDDVTFHTSRVYVPGLAVLAGVPIVPAHIWRGIADPLTFANPNPVATGPFTEVQTFENQVYELGRNPRYWQTGKPYVEALRFLAYPGNDQANMALVEGSVDWAGNFVPAIDRTFVRRDPEHNRYWFPLVGSTVFLYANTTRAPFDDVRVRRALSLALNRQRIVDVAMYGYTVPASATGLSDSYRAWRLAEELVDGWVHYDLDAANALLDEAGLTRGADGIRRGPNNAPLRYEIDVVSGWSDWVRAAQVVATDLRAVGIDATVRPAEFSAWFSDLQRGDFDLAVSWSNDGPTPYAFYRWQMSPDTVQPLGEVAAGNWHRLGDPESKALLDAFERTAEPAEQARLAEALQRRFAALVPAIPLFPNPQWAAYSTRRFDGFPSPDAPYASPSPNALPSALLVLTSLRPRGATP